MMPPCSASSPRPGDFQRGDTRDPAGDEGGIDGGKANFAAHALAALQGTHAARFARHPTSLVLCYFGYAEFPAK